jgi:hypothetical protein
MEYIFPIFNMGKQISNVFLTSDDTQIIHDRSATYGYIPTMIYFGYILYIAFAFFDIEVNIETILYTIIILLFTSIAWLCLDIAGINLYSSIYPGRHAIIFGIMITIAVIIPILIYFQYYYLTVNVTRKIQSNLVHLLDGSGYPSINYEYGRDSQEIATRLDVNHGAIANTPHPGTLNQLWESLMIDSSQNKIKTALAKILHVDLNDNISVYYDLFWYLCISRDPFRNGLSNDEIKYVASLSTDNLANLLGPHYNGAADRASMLFTALAGRSIPNPGKNTRYDQVSQYDPAIVYNLAFVHNQMINHDDGVYSVYGPYTYLSTLSSSEIEGIMASINNTNYHEIIEKLEIGPINNIDFMSENEKVSYVRSEVSLYHNVFTRPNDTGLPPDLNGLNKEEIYSILLKYTNMELIDAYEPRGKWLSRNELISLIYEDVTVTTKWSIHSILNCNNDETMNILTGYKHGDTDKRDRDDPTLSFGTQKNYQCYQATEL